MMQYVLPLNRGSDYDFTGTLTDSIGAPINLTGYTISALEASAELSPHLTLTITDAPNGKFTGRIEWDDGFPNGLLMQFRIKFRSGINDQTWPQIWIDVQ